MRLLLSLLFLAVSIPAQALVVEKPLTDPVLEQQAQSLFHGLRCVVCEGQSLAESDAVFAQQMRAEIRRMLRDGDTEATIQSYFTERYGDRILLMPPVAPRTYLLWAMPALLLAVAALFLRPRRKGVST